MDVDIGKETDNRTEILTKGMEAIKAKVRSDMQEEWTRLAEGVDVAPLVRKTTKPTGKDFFSAPLLFHCAGQDQEVEDGGDTAPQQDLPRFPLATGNDACTERLQDCI
jgi:hypothetical protein